MRPYLVLLLTLSACGEKEEPEDTGHAGDGGTEDGGSTDGGATDGGTDDGGATDGGSTDGGAEGVDLAALLTRSGGCGDTFIWATNADQTWAMWFRDDSDIALRAYRAGETITDTYDMALDYALSPTVAVQQGSNLQVAFCNDVVEDYSVTQEWYATAGLVTISVTSDGTKEPWGEVPGTATLTLDDVVLTTTGADPVTISHYETTVSVGWFPG